MTRIGDGYTSSVGLHNGKTNAKATHPIPASPPNATRNEPGTDASTVTLSPSSAPKTPATYAPPAAHQGAPAMMTFNYFSFGDTGPSGGPSGPTRIEYNVYRPDGLSIDATTSPFTILATGEKLTDEVARKYQAMLYDVTKHRVDIYQVGKADGLSTAQIIENLKAYDRSLPDSYRALVGDSAMTDPETRYTQQTVVEALGGPVQTE